MVLAIPFDDFFCFSQVFAGHGGEEVVFNLVVKTSKKIVFNRRGGDVTGRSDLFLQIRGVSIWGAGGHACVVGYDDHGKIEPSEDGGSRVKQQGFGDSNKIGGEANPEDKMKEEAGHFRG